MDRGFVYPAQQPLETDILFPQRASLIALAKLSSAALAAEGGSPPVAAGILATPGTGLTVSVSAGSLYVTYEVDATPYSSLETDTDNVLKQYLVGEPVTLSTPAPGTAGQSINYLIQVATQEQDIDDTVLAFYNSTNPSQPYSGPNNDGDASATIRNLAAVVTVVAGTPAATGTQTTPAPSGGNYPLQVVTVAHGQSSIITGNISTPSNSILLQNNLQVWQQSLQYLCTQAAVTFAGGAQATLYNAIAALIAAEGNGATPQPSYAALQAYTGPAAGYAFMAVQNWNLGVPGGGGIFVYIASDSASADNGGTIAVDGLNRRWYRLYDGDLWSSYFGLIDDEFASDQTAKMNKWLAALQVGSNGRNVRGKLQTGGFRRTQPLWATSPTQNGCIEIEAEAPYASEIQFDFLASNVTPSSVTSSGNTITMNFASPHGQVVGSRVSLNGAAQTAYNGTFSVLTVPTANSLTCAANSTPSASPATGTINVALNIDGLTVIGQNVRFGKISLSSSAARNAGSNIATGDTLNAAYPYRIINNTLASSFGASQLSSYRQRLAGILVTGGPGHGYAINVPELVEMDDCQAFAAGSDGFFPNDAGVAAGGINNRMVRCSAISCAYRGFTFGNVLNMKATGCESLSNLQAMTLPTGSGMASCVDEVFGSGRGLDLDGIDVERNDGGVSFPTTLTGNGGANLIRLTGSRHRVSGFLRGGVTMVDLTTAPGTIVESYDLLGNGGNATTNGVIVDAGSTACRIGPPGTISNVTNPLVRNDATPNSVVQMPNGALQIGGLMTNPAQTRIVVGAGGFTPFMDNNGTHVRISLTADAAIGFPTNPIIGEIYIFDVQNDNGGGWNLNFATPNYRFQTAYSGSGNVAGSKWVGMFLCTDTNYFCQIGTTPNWF